ncbi:Cerato-platanin-domain-containing protein [Aspergillus unguis]
MKLFAISALATLALAAPNPSLKTRQTGSTTLSYDPKFDVGSSSLNTVSCSDGDYGLVTEGYTTFDSLPTFARIGGAPTIAGWNDAKCGSCYSITWTSATGASNSIIVTAIDSSPGGFNVATTAMNQLTGGRAEELGRVDVTYTEVGREQCGLKARA